jgi:hypothetical protein
MVQWNQGLDWRVFVSDISTSGRGNTALFSQQALAGRVVNQDEA